MPSEPSIHVGTSRSFRCWTDGRRCRSARSFRWTVDWDAERARFPWAFASADHWAWHVRSFLVRSDAVEVLVDTGIGHLGRPPYDVEGQIDPSLHEAGSSPSSIRHVVHTHLHADHAGGACRPDGTPRFPGVTHHVHDADWRFFVTATDDDDFEGRSAMTSLEAAGQLSISSDDRTIVEGVRVLHTDTRRAPGARWWRAEGRRCCSRETSSTSRSRSRTPSGRPRTTRTGCWVWRRAGSCCSAPAIGVGVWRSLTSGGRSAGSGTIAGRPRPDRADGGGTNGPPAQRPAGVDSEAKRTGCRAAGSLSGPPAHHTILRLPIGDTVPKGRVLPWRSDVS